MPAAGQKRILFDGLNIRWGGGLTVSKRVALGFRDAGHDVHIMLNSQKLADAFDGETGINIHLPKGTLSAMGALTYRHGAFASFEKNLAPEILFSFNYHTPSATPQVTYHINTIPYLPLRERIEAVGATRALIHRYFALKACQKSKLNLFESGHLLDLAKQSGTITGPHVAHIGTDSPQAPFERVLDPDMPVITTVTSGAPHKHNEHMLAAFRKFSARHPSAKLKIIGQTDYISDNLSADDQLYVQTNPNIEFSGYVDRNALFQQLAQSTCLVTFSQLESFFMVAIEAMRVGCPVVGSDISSIRESVGDHALLFDPGDVDQAVEHMIRVVTDNQVIDKVSAQEWADSFDAEICARKIVAMVEENLS